MVHIEKNVIGSLSTYMYNEWNFLHSYKIKSYKLISLDKKKWVSIKIIYQ